MMADMKRWLLLGLMPLLGCDALLFERKPPGNHYTREGYTCACTDCKCNHCTRAEKGARCYCGTGGCSCPLKRGACDCKHCTGVAGGCDGKNNCDCSK
jgi:hypothetical protein